MNHTSKVRLLAALVSTFFFFLVAPPVFADYDDEDSDCPGNSCNAPPGQGGNGGNGGDGGNGGRGGRGGEGGEGGDGFGLGIGIGKGGNGYGGDGGSVGDITVEGDKTRVSNDTSIRIGGDKTRVEQDNDQRQTTIVGGSRDKTYVGVNVDGDKLYVAGDKTYNEGDQLYIEGDEGDYIEASDLTVGPVDNSTQVTSEFDINGPSVTVEGASLTNELYWEAADVAAAAREEAKGLVRAAEKHSERAPDPARAMATGCDTGGFTVQTGVAGGGNSAPTFPCEVMRSQMVKNELPSGFFNQFVVRLLINGRIVSKGLTSWIPIIGN